MAKSPRRSTPKKKEYFERSEKQIRFLRSADTVHDPKVSHFFLFFYYSPKIVPFGGRIEGGIARIIANREQ